MNGIALHSQKASKLTSSARSIIPTAPGLKDQPVLPPNHCPSSSFLSQAAYEIQTHTHVYGKPRYATVHAPKFDGRPS